MKPSKEWFVKIPYTQFQGVFGKAHQAVGYLCAPSSSETAKAIGQELKDELNKAADTWEIE